MTDFATRWFGHHGTHQPQSSRRASTNDPAVTGAEIRESRALAASEHLDAMIRLVAELKLATTIEEVRLIEGKMSRAADNYYACLLAATVALRAEIGELTAGLGDLEARSQSARTFIDVDSV